MSELKSRPPVKPRQDLDEFLSGAENKAQTKTQTSTKVESALPWEEAGIREDVTKVYNLRLSEPYLLKLRYIADHTPDSMQTFCLSVLKDAIDKKINELIK
ncbi:hypothetical protein [Nitrosomonas sp. Is37]|uniref:hypothetical protein n=1 Tax=Nitrosomonas sp. Is37 TaxID=3080535 RepID=UPI00294B41A8|nr:hypothetical protein [Nitrosomonas sp. Is37]MDV6344736.1 hypothetical protein [Nitrosomonas sp. Is37]